MITFSVDSKEEEEDCDDYYIAESNCEIATVQGQLCSIPYELYDLPDLTGIISTETWNSILTEEERFFLSCFLPDMDQDSFALTLQQLFVGADLYFGNPVRQFYARLRGGLFDPKVASCKEALTLLKRKGYYYSLQSYHEKMNKTFFEMQRYEKGLSNKGRQRGDLKLLDLNRVPYESIDGGASYKLTTLNEVSVERSRFKRLTSTFGGGSKNCLKIKITNKGVFRHRGGSSLLASSEHTLPKGLLKVAPKYSSEPYLATANNFLQIQETGPLSSSSEFAASQYSGTKFRKPYGTTSCSITELPKCLLNHQDTSFTHLETTQSSSEGTEPVLHELIHTEHNLPRKQEDYAHYYLKSPGLKLGMMVDRGFEILETKRVLSGVNTQKESNLLRKPRYVVSKDAHHASESGDDHLFPSTHKRRKVERISIA